MTMIPEPIFAFMQYASQKIIRLLRLLPSRSSGSNLYIPSLLNSLYQRNDQFPLRSFFNTPWNETVFESTQLLQELGSSTC